MHTISVSLTLSGIHGLTEKEHTQAQRFAIQVDAECREYPLHDSITNTVDYRHLRDIARLVVEGERHNLLESLAEGIASGVVTTLPVDKVTVQVRKLDIWDIGTPSVTVTRYRFPERLNLLDFSFEDVLETLRTEGGISIPILPEERRLLLLDEAKAHSYKKQPETANNGLVREDINSCTKFPLESAFYSLRDDFMELLLMKVHQEKAHHLFSPPLSFTEMSLLRYDTGSFGITPHRDGRSILNLICVFTLGGRADFALCDNRNGSNPRFLSTEPGHVIIMRAPGFYGSSFQPLHFVQNVTEERYVFGLRQK
ncbi:MAG TPA: dihydroneopterin aldolase [Verrucomicrobiae bacterium]|nr:dihydroneopterin aldolase [Verrucomicrobiae bacterium]